MIITVTLNPALDKFIKLDSLNVGELNRFNELRIQAGGKGINVARVLNTLDKDVLAMSVLGGHSGMLMQEIMDDEGIPFDITSSNFSTRENIKIIENNDQETELNQQGQLDLETYLRFKESLKKYLKKAKILILSGSVPKGISLDIYQDLIMMAKNYNVKTLLDTSGVPLQLGIKSSPFLIKPNLFELSNLLGKKHISMSDLYQAVLPILNKGVENIIISVGEQGAFYANKVKFYQIVPPKIKMPDTTVGAGDSMVAALAIAIDEGVDFLQMAIFATSVATLYVSGEEIKQENIDNIKDRLEIVEGERSK